MTAKRIEPANPTSVFDRVSDRRSSGASAVPIKKARGNARQARGRAPQSAVVTTQGKDVSPQENLRQRDYERARGGFNSGVVTRGELYESAARAGQNIIRINSDPAQGLERKPGGDPTLESGGGGRNRLAHFFSGTLRREPVNTRGSSVGSGTIDVLPGGKAPVQGAGAQAWNPLEGARRKRMAEMASGAKWGSSG
jgi:hypothetical protein